MVPEGMWCGDKAAPQRGYGIGTKLLPKGRYGLRRGLLLGELRVQQLGFSCFSVLLLRGR